MFAPAIACGNAFILKPSERDPSVPLMLAELMEEAGLPKGILQVVQGDKEAVDAMLDHDVIQSVGFVGSTPIAEYIYGRGCSNGKRVQAFGGAKNHMIVMPDADMDQAADALIGSGYGAAGERCMAISVAVPVGEETADRLVDKLVPRIEKLKVGPYTAGDDVDYGPLVTAEARDRVRGLVNSGVEQGAELVVDGRDFTLQGYENGFFVGPHLFDRLTPDMDIYRQEIFGPVLSTVRAGSYEEALRQRHRDLHPRRRCRARLRQPDQHRDGGRQRADPGAAGLSHLRRLEEVDVRRPEPARARRLQVLHPHQDGHLALALGAEGRRRVPLQGDGLRGGGGALPLLPRDKPGAIHPGIFRARRRQGPVRCRFSAWHHAPGAFSWRGAHEREVPWRSPSRNSPSGWRRNTFSSIATAWTWPRRRRS
jgi:hypothetical protein